MVLLWDKENRKYSWNVWHKALPLIHLSCELLFIFFLSNVSHPHFLCFLTDHTLANCISLSSLWDAFFYFSQLLAVKQLLEPWLLLMSPVDSSQPCQQWVIQLQEVSPVHSVCSRENYTFTKHLVSLDSFTLVQAMPVFIWRTHYLIIIIILTLWKLLLLSCTFFKEVSWATKSDC